MLQKLVKFHEQMCLLPMLFNNVFHVLCLSIWCHHDIWISEKSKFDYLKNEKSFHVLKVLSFRYTKQISKNVVDTTFKKRVCYFSFFSPNDNPFKGKNNYKKCFLFHLKSSFQSRDTFKYQIFSSSHLFFPVSHWLRGSLKINLKVYDISNCLNKNLITHFVWQFEREKRCNIELCQFIEH